MTDAPALEALATLQRQEEDLHGQQTRRTLLHDRRKERKLAEIVKAADEGNKTGEGGGGSSFSRSSSSSKGMSNSSRAGTPTEDHGNSSNSAPTTLKQQINAKQLQLEQEVLQHKLADTEEKLKLAKQDVLQKSEEQELLLSQKNQEVGSLLQKVGDLQQQIVDMGNWINHGMIKTKEEDDTEETEESRQASLQRLQHAEEDLARYREQWEESVCAKEMLEQSLHSKQEEISLLEQKIEVLTDGRKNDKEKLRKAQLLDNDRKRTIEKLKEAALSDNQLKEEKAKLAEEREALERKKY